MANSSTQSCDFGEMTWRETYLTANIRKNLVAITIVNSFSAILTIVLNALVITAVITRPQLRSNSNKLLACLAGTDLMTGALVQPLTIVSNIKRILGAGPYCDVDKTSAVFLILVSMASFHQLTLVGIERYVAIKRPLRYRDIVTHRRLKTGVLLAWAIAVVEIMSYNIPTVIHSQEPSVYWTYIDKIIIAIGLVNISVIIYTNAFIFSETRRHNKRLQSQQVSQEEAKRLKNDNRAAKTVLIVVGALLCSYLPILVMLGLLTTLAKLVESRILYVLIAWSGSFATLGSLFNPLIYCWRLKKFRNAFLGLLHLRQAQNSPDVELMAISRQQVQPAVIQSSTCVGQEPGVIMSFSALHASSDHILY